MDGGSIQSKFSDLKGVRDGGQLCFREPLDIGGRHREGSIIRGAYEKQSKTKHSGVQQLEVPSTNLGQLDCIFVTIRKDSADIYVNQCDLFSKRVCEVEA